MNYLKTLAAGLVIAFGLATAVSADPNEITITLKDGPVVVRLLPSIAPKHVARLKELAKQGAYDNVAFHRVIEGFMAQTGDVQYGNMEKDFVPEMAGTGGSKLPDLPAEFSSETFDRGVLGMARSQNPDSANSQFFIMFAPGPFLDGQYTVVGKVVSGMEFVDRIKRGDQANNGSVNMPDRMINVTVGN